MILKSKYTDVNRDVSIVKNVDSTFNDITKSCPTLWNRINASKLSYFLKKNNQNFTTNLTKTK